MTPGIKWMGRSILVALAAAPLLGCSSGGGNIGDGELAIDKTRLDSYAAVWEGYVEAYHFQSGTDRVRITIDAMGNGTLQVGDMPLLPPPSDPDVGYPPAVAQVLHNPALNYKIYDGIAYPLQNLRVEAERVRFSFDAHAAFSQWCALQPPQLETGTNPPWYSCVNHPNYGENDTCQATASDGQTGIPVDCGKAMLCGLETFVCTCDATSCATELGRAVNLMDAALDETGEHLNGTLLTAGTGVAIRLTRQ